MPTEEIRKGEEWALKNGTHALMYKVLKSEPCGCAIQGAGNLKSPVRIVFCKKHKAALKVIEKIFVAHECPVGENFCHIHKILEEAGFIKAPKN